MCGTATSTSSRAPSAPTSGSTPSPLLPGLRCLWVVVGLPCACLGLAAAQLSWFYRSLSFSIGNRRLPLQEPNLAYRFCETACSASAFARLLPLKPEPQYLVPHGCLLLQLLPSCLPLLACSCRCDFRNIHICAAQCLFIAFALHSVT